MRRWSGSYALLVDEVSTWVRSATDEQLAEMLDHCALYAQTNCWWADYQMVHQIVVPALRTEMLDRKLSARVAADE